MLEWSPEDNAWLVSDLSLVEVGLRAEGISAIRSDTAIQNLPAAVRSVGDELQAFYRNWPLFSDPPLHTSRRGLSVAILRTLFTNDVRQDIVVGAHRLASEFAADVPPLDGVQSFARPFSQMALRRLFNLRSQSDIALERHAENLVEYIGDRENAELAVRAGASLNAVRRLATGLIEDERGDEANVVTAGQRLAAEHHCSLDEALAISMNLLVDGYFPVESSVAAGMVHLVDAWPAARDESAARLADTAIALATPFQYCSRTAVCATMLGGREVRAGQKVRFMLCGPKTVAAKDNAAQHLAFGRGIHQCPARGFARFAVGAALDAFRSEFALLQPHLVGSRPVEWRESSGYRSPIRVAVSWAT